jgi:hypothetical protein
MVKPKKNNEPPDKALIAIRLKKKKKLPDMISKNRFKRAADMFYNGMMVEYFLKTTKRSKLNEDKSTNSEPTFSLARMKDFLNVAIRLLIHSRSIPVCSNSEKELEEGRHSALGHQQYAGSLRML